MTNIKPANSRKFEELSLLYISLWKSILLVIAITPMIYGCVSLEVTNIEPPLNPPMNLVAKSIMVLPFKGDEMYTAPAGEWFSHKLSSYGLDNIIAPSQAEIMRDDSKSQVSFEDISRQSAIEIGNLLDTDIIVIGELRAESDGFRWSAICEVELIDINTKESIGVYTGTDIVTTYFDIHAYYMRAANKAALLAVGGKQIHKDTHNEHAL